MLKKLIPLAILPLIAFAQPAEARRLFWWETINPEVDSPPPPPPQGYQNAYGYPDTYETPDDRFNQRQYELYRREMWRRYRNGEIDSPPEDVPYAAPIQRPRVIVPPVTEAPVAKPKPKKIAKAKSVVKKPEVAVQAPPAAAPKPATAKQVNTATATPKPATGTVSCEKGASIVSSFGFENVTTKTCEADTLAYKAERSGKPFEISVNPKTGELIAVKKIETTGSLDVPPQKPKTTGIEL